MAKIIHAKTEVKKNLDDYGLVEAAFVEIKNRHHILPLEKILEYESEGYPKPAWAGMNRFDTELPDYVKRTKGVRDFPGVGVPRIFVFDIDNETRPDVAQQAINHLNQFLIEVKGVPPEGVQPYFSGVKGFHDYLPLTLFGNFEPSNYPHSLLKHMAKEILTEAGIDPDIFDSNIYHKTSLMRMPYSVRNNGCRKIPLTHDEVASKTINEIYALSRIRNNLEIVPDSEFLVNPFLNEILERSKQALNERSNFVRTQYRQITFAEKPCWQRLLASGFSDGRKRIAFRLACAFRLEGFDEDEVLSRLFAWNRKNKRPLVTNQLQSIVRYSHPKYDYRCGDAFLSKYCTSNCPIRKGGSKPPRIWFPTHVVVPYLKQALNEGVETDPSRWEMKEMVIYSVINTFENQAGEKGIYKNPKPKCVPRRRWEKLKSLLRKQSHSTWRWK